MAAPSKKIEQQQVTPDSQMKNHGIDPVKIINSKANKQSIENKEIEYINVINDITRQQALSKAIWIDFLTDLDLRQWCNILIWENVPNNIPSWLINQMAYYRGTLAAFEYNGQFYMLPWVQTGKINIYGLPTEITPITYNGTADVSNPIAFSKTYQCIINNSGNYEEKANTIIYYANMPVWQQGNVIAPYIKNRKVIEQCADILARINIQVVVTNKKIFLKCDDVKQAQNLLRQLNKSLNSQSPFAVIGSMNTETIELQPTVQNASDLWLHLKGFNDIRNMSNGLANDGFFDKKERKITAEAEGSQEQTSLPLQDRLYFAKLLVEQCKLQFNGIIEGIEKFNVRINEELIEQEEMEEDEENQEVENGN